MLPLVHGVGTTVEYDGKLYGTLAGVAVDGTGTLCQKDYLPLPDGPGRCVLAPDTPEVRANVVAKHTWSTHVVVLASGKPINTKAIFSGSKPPGAQYNSNNYLSTSGKTHKPSSCTMQILYECNSGPTPVPTPVPTPAPTPLPTTIAGE